MLQVPRAVVGGAINLLAISAGFMAINCVKEGIHKTVNTVADEILKKMNIETPKLEELTEVGEVLKGVASGTFLGLQDEKAGIPDSFLSGTVFAVTSLALLGIGQAVRGQSLHNIYDVAIGIPQILIKSFLKA
jgi:hypothetical protein